MTQLPLARHKGLIVRKLSDEVLVYDLERNKAHCLNLTSARVWKYCDGKTTVEEMVRLLNKDSSTPLTRDLVLLALNQLQKFHLLQQSLQLPFISRRDLVFKYAPAAVILPVILTIAVPTAQAQASCLPLGAACSTFSQCCSGCCSGSLGPAVCAPFSDCT